MTMKVQTVLSPYDRARLESVEAIIEDCADRLLRPATLAQREDISGELVDQAMRIHALLNWPGEPDDVERVVSRAA